MVKAGEDEEVGEAVPGYPLLAPPRQFQTCLSPSQQYSAGPGRLTVASPAYSNDSVSSALTSSTATEKSVR